MLHRPRLAWILALAACGDNLEPRVVEAAELDSAALPLPDPPREFSLSAAAFVNAVTATGPVRARPLAVQASMFMALPLDVGERLKLVTASCLGPGAPVDGVFSLLRTTATGMDTIISMTAEPLPIIGWQDVAMADPAPAALRSGDSVSLAISFRTAPTFCGNVRVTVD